MDKRLYFVKPDGSLWFELTDYVKKIQEYNIRLKLGGDRAIHELIKNETRRSTKMEKLS
jgi:hypothetical protein